MGKRRTQAQAAAHPRTQDPVPTVLQGSHAERDRRATPDLADARLPSALADTRSLARSDPGAVRRLPDRWRANRGSACALLEDADASRANEQAEDDEDHAGHDPSSEERDDAGDHEDHRQDPKQRRGPTGQRKDSEHVYLLF